MARRLIPRLLLAAATGLALAGPVQAGDLSVKLDGKTLDASPVMVNGRVMIPLRSVFEGLGATVKYDGATQQIHAEGSKHVVDLKLGDPKAVIDGRTVTLETPAGMIEGKTMVPLRFVAEAFGASVQWNAQARTVEITSHGGAAAARPATPAPQSIGDFDPRVDLKRLACGNQSAVCKVFAEDGKTVAFFKGLDDRLQAKLTLAEREGIRQAEGIPAERTGEAVDLLVDFYGDFPKRPSLALLGVLANQDWIGEGRMAKVRTFLADRMHNDKDVACRRMAALALALVSDVDQATVDEVVRFYSTRDNLWETFPVQQFFEYHAEKVRALPTYGNTRQQVTSVNSLYTKNILEYLQ